MPTSFIPRPLAHFSAKAAVVVLFFALLLAACGGGGGGVPIIPVPDIPAPPTTTPTTPAAINLSDRDIGALHNRDGDGSFHFLVFRIDDIVNGDSITVDGQNIIYNTLAVTRYQQPQGFDLHLLNRNVFNGDLDSSLRSMISPTGTVILAARRGQVFVEGRTDITTAFQLCSARWLGDYINRAFVNDDGTNLCIYPSSSPGSPNLGRVIGAVMNDGFNNGFALWDSGFAFSGRYDGNERAAGFVYDIGGFALRTDYVRLPAAQNNAIYLDTYRFGVLQDINDKTRTFAGVDSYNNAIIAIDISDSNFAHRFGAAIGDGYAVKYELHLQF